jgi:MFS family permease
MKPWSTTYTDDSLLKMIGRPFFVLVNPVILWAILIIAFSQLWNVVINFTIVQIFSPPPYLMGTAEIGYITGGPIIGGVMGCFICGALSDRLCRAISRRNNGVFEPEFRLLLMLGVPICSVGFFLFGNLAEKGESPVVMAVIWGVAFVSVQFASNAAGGYLVDAFRDLSVSVFISAMAVKNFMFFGFSCKLHCFCESYRNSKIC